MKSNKLKIPLPDLFDFKECLWFLDRNLDNCMHVVSGNHVTKLICNNNEPVLIKISATDVELIIEILYGVVRDPKAVIDFVEEWFDLDRNIKPFYTLMKKDADLYPLIKKYKGFRIVGIPNLFEALCWCVMGQQINLQFAYKIKRRFVEQYGQSILYEDKRYYLFPLPEVIQEVSMDELKSFQLTTRKSEYILGITKLFTKGALSKSMLMELSSEPDMLDTLTGVRGIGEWTANYALMKSLRAMNCVPYGDVGINNALHDLKGFDKKNNRIVIDRFFDQFNGWKTYLVFYLWRSLR